MSINPDNLINNIRNLHSLTDNKYMISDELLSEIITPEWFYSKSKRIFEDISISWESLLKSDLINDISLNEKLSAISRRDIVFEKSFCSWYQPYHVLPDTKWGIHIRFSSWIKATSLFHSEEPHLTSRLNNSIVAAFLYIYVHGIFHYAIENVISLMELDIEKPIVYNDYYTNKYLQTFNTLDCLEESLANAYLYENASECHIDKEYLKNLLLNQENAYANFLTYTDTEFLKGCIKLISLVKDRNKDLSNYKIKDIEQFFDFQSLAVFKNQVPVWLHHNPNPLN
jgi:hypothetical protein